MGPLALSVLTRSNLHTISAKECMQQSSRLHTTGKMVFGGIGRVEHAPRPVIHTRELSVSSIGCQILHTAYHVGRSAPDGKFTSLDSYTICERGGVTEKTRLPVVRGLQLGMDRLQSVTKQFN